MSKAERWMIALGVVAIILAGIQTWIIVANQEERKAGTVKIIFIVLSSLVIVGLNAFSIYRNLKDANRATDLRVDINALKIDHAQEIKSLEQIHKDHEKKADQQRNSDLSRAQTIGEQLKAEKREAINETRALREQLRDRELQITSLELQLPPTLDGVPVIGPAIMAMLRAKKNLTHDVDLHGEILEMLYQTEYSGFGFHGFKVLLRVRVTNFGSDPTTITNWRLRIDLGKDYWTGNQEAIPLAWVIEREGPLNLLARPSLTLDEAVPFPANEPLKKGVPQSGWLLFGIVQSWLPRFEFPSGGQFAVIATDSFGSDNLIIKPCGGYAAQGKISYKKS